MLEQSSIIGEKWEVCLEGRWFRIPRRENSLCQSTDFKLCGIFEKGRIDLGGVDGSQIALGELSGHELLYK